MKNFANIRNKMVEMQRSISVFEEKLAEVLTQVNSTEACLLAARLAEFEDRQGHLNLGISGFPEKAEGKDAISFLRKVLSEIRVSHDVLHSARWK